MKKLIFALVVLSASLFSPLGLQPAYAACPGDGQNEAKDQVLKGTDTTGSDCSGEGVTEFIGTVVTILSIIVGIAAVIMVILSGFKYITSAGDANKIASAKTTLIYAIVGIAIAVLAQLIVRFVVNESSVAIKRSQPCPSGQHRSEDGSKCINNN